MKCTGALRVLLGMLQLALPKSVTAVPVSSCGVRGILDLGDSFSSFYSKRVSLAVERRSEKTDKCSGSLDIWYMDTCIKLASRGTPCCPASQRLVLQKPYDQRRTLPIRPICVEIPCNDSTVWWDPLQKCIPTKDVDKVCGKGNIFRTDPFGDVYCDCPRNRGQLIEGADCHEYYQQGPCRSDEVLVFDPASTLGKCASDLCDRENKLWAADEEKARSGVPGAATRRTEEVTRKVFAPLNGTGPCHKLDSPDDCEPSKDESKNVAFTIDFESHLPLCLEFRSAQGVAGISVPACSNFDREMNKCPGEVIVEPGPQDPYNRANRGPFYPSTPQGRTTRRVISEPYII